MFVKAVAVMHAYMRRAGVLPNGKKMCVSIKSRTRQAKNKAGRMDTKCSLHATVHVMEPAERHKTVITKILDMVRRDKPSAYKAMMEKDGLQRGIQSPGRCVLSPHSFFPHLQSPPFHSLNTAQAAGDGGLRWVHGYGHSHDEQLAPANPVDRIVQGGRYRVPAQGTRGLQGDWGTDSH